MGADSGSWHRWRGCGWDEGSSVSRQVRRRLDSQDAGAGGGAERRRCGCRAARSAAAAPASSREAPLGKVESVSRCRKGVVKE